MGSVRIGWVLGGYDDAERAAAAALAPEFLFCDVDRLPQQVDDAEPPPAGQRRRCHAVTDDEVVVAGEHRVVGLRDVVVVHPHLDAVADFIVRFRPAGTILYCNDAYARLRGTTREALVGTNLFPYIHHAERANLHRQLARVTPEAPQVRYVAPVFHDGTRHYQEWVEHGLFDPAGRVVEFQSVGRDVTTRIVAEERLRESEER